MTYDYWIVAIGLTVGLVARFVVPGRRPINLPLALVLGGAGAYGGLYAAQRFALVKPGDTGGFIAAVAGAAALLVLFVALFRREG